MATGQIRAAILGAGLMGRWHARALRKAGATVVAVADPNAKAGESLARNNGTCRTFGSAAELLDAVEVDVVHVCTPRETHVELSMLALGHDCHLMVEKPLAADAHETASVLRAAKDARRFVCPVHQFPFQRGARRAARWLSGAGPVLHFDMTLCSAGGEGRSPGEREAILADMLPHPLSLIGPLGVAQPRDVEWYSARSAAGELNVQGVAGTTHLRFLLSLSARPTEATATIRTTRGTLHLDFFHGYAVREGGRVSRRRKLLRPFALSSKQLGGAAANLMGRALRGEAAYPGLRELVCGFYKAVRDERAAPIPPDDSLAVAQARDAILEAAHVQ